MEKEELLLKFKEKLRILHYSSLSIESYQRCVKDFLLWVSHADKSLKEIIKEDILEYNTYLKQKNYSANSVQRYMHSVKQFYKYLEDTFYILVNPMEGFIINKVPQKIPAVLTESEVKRIIEQANVSTRAGIRDRAILEVLYSTGIRLGELRNLTIFDIDTRSGFLRVTQGKFKKDRFTPLTKAAGYWLKQYIEKARPHFTKNRGKEQGLFVGHCGRRMNKLIIERQIKKYTESAGIKKRVTPHTFRHTFASHLLNNGVDIFKIQKLLGHSRVSITQIYAQVNPKQIKEAHSRCHPREKTRDEGRGGKDEG